MNEQQEFLDYIAQHPEDSSARLVYADWLEEHDQLEEADRQRKYALAEKWLRKFAKKCGETCTNYNEVWNTYFESDQSQEAGEQASNAEQYQEITYEMVVQAGIDYIESDGNEWFTQYGSEGARDQAYGKTLKEYWKNIEIVTGLKVPNKFQDESPFSCSC